MEIALTFRCSVLACGVVNILWIIFNVIIISVRCIPFSKNWLATEPGTRLPLIPVVAVVAGWGLAIELAIWSLPIPASWRLQFCFQQSSAESDFRTWYFRHRCWHRASGHDLTSRREGLHVVSSTRLAMPRDRAKYSHHCCMLDGLSAFDGKAWACELAAAL